MDECAANRERTGCVCNQDRQSMAISCARPGCSSTLSCFRISSYLALLLLLHFTGPAQGTREWTFVFKSVKTTCLYTHIVFFCSLPVLPPPLKYVCAQRSPHTKFWFVCVCPLTLRCATALQWERVEPVGLSPSARHSHAAATMSSAQGMVYLFGG